MVENGYLPVELTDSAVNIRFVQLHARVVDKIAGGEIVASVYNDVISGDDPGSVGGCQPFRISFNLNGMVQGLQPFLRTECFHHSRFGF